jgi:hypothetical protein
MAKKYKIVKSYDRFSDNFKYRIYRRYLWFFWVMEGSHYDIYDRLEWAEKRVEKLKEIEGKKKDIEVKYY